MSQAYGILKSSDKGTPIAGANVTLFASGGVKIISDITDSEGNFSLDNDSVDNSSSYLEFSSPGYLTIDYPSAGFTGGGNVEMDPSTIVSKVPSWVWIIIVIVLIVAGIYLFKHLKK